MIFYLHAKPIKFGPYPDIATAHEAFNGMIASTQLAEPKACLCLQCGNNWLPIIVGQGLPKDPDNAFKAREGQERLEAMSPNEESDHLLWRRAKLTERIKDLDGHLHWHQDGHPASRAARDLRDELRNELAALEGYSAQEALDQPPNV